MPNYKPKKKVLSNKQLTRQVRSLKNTEGHRRYANGEAMFSAVTLTAGTSDLTYFTGTPFTPNAGEKFSIHYVDTWVKLLCSVSGGATVRLIYGIDEEGQTDATGANILLDQSDSVSRYASGASNTMELNHKNRQTDFRFRIVKDMLIPLIQNEPKCFKVKLPLYNRVLRSDGSNFSFRPFILALSDDNNSIINIEALPAYTSEI